MCFCGVTSGLFWGYQSLLPSVVVQNGFIRALGFRGILRDSNTFPLSNIRFRVWIYIYIYAIYWTIYTLLYIHILYKIQKLKFVFFGVYIYTHVCMYVCMYVCR